MTVRSGAHIEGYLDQTGGIGGCRCTFGAFRSAFAAGEGGLRDGMVRSPSWSSAAEGFSCLLVEPLLVEAWEVLRSDDIAGKNRMETRNEYDSRTGSWKIVYRREMSMVADGKRDLEQLSKHFTSVHYTPCQIKTMNAHFPFSRLIVFVPDNVSPLNFRCPLFLSSSTCLMMTTIPARCAKQINDATHHIKSIVFATMSMFFCSHSYSCMHNGARCY